MDSHQQTIIYDFILSKELGVFDDVLHQLLLNLPANSKFLFTFYKVVVFQSYCWVRVLPYRDLCLSALRGAFEVVPEINLILSIEHVVHDREVYLFTHLAFLLVKNNFVEA